MIIPIVLNLLWFVFNWLMFVLEIWLTTVRLQTTSDLLYISDAFYFSIIGFNDDCNYAIMSNIKRDIDQRWWWWWTLFFPFCFSLSFFPIDMLLPPMFNGKARFQDGHRSSHLLLSLIIFLIIDQSFTCLLPVPLWLLFSTAFTFVSMDFQMSFDGRDI